MIDFENIIKKLKLNKKGQAFSTFQLLIAAVVALALLGVLLPIIMKNVDIGDNPEELTQRLIKTQIDSIGSLKYTKEATFKNGDSISGATLANSANLDRSEVCVLNPEGSTFEGDGGKIITYNSSSSLKYKMGVLCDYSDKLEESVDYFVAEMPANSDDCYTSLGIDDYDDGPIKKVCIVFPKRA